MAPGQSVYLWSYVLETLCLKSESNEYKEGDMLDAR